MAVVKQIVPGVEEQVQAWIAKTRRPESDDAIMRAAGDALRYERSAPGSTQTRLLGAASKLDETNGGKLVVAALKLFTKTIDVMRGFQAQGLGHVNRSITDQRSREGERGLAIGTEIQPDTDKPLIH